MLHASRGSRGAVGGALSLGLALSGCAGTTPAVPDDGLVGGSVVEKRARFAGIVADNCPTGRTVDQGVYVDASASSKGLGPERLPIVLASARITAICGGHLRVVVFSGSISEATPIYEAELEPGDGTETSRVLKADDAIARLAETIRPSLEQPEVDPRGTDVLAVLQDAAEFASSTVSEDRRFRVLVVTDGANTVGDRITKATTPDQAVELAQATQVPDLSGAEVIFTGIGIFGGDKKPTSAHVQALKAYVQEICNRAIGAECPAPTTNYSAN